MLYINHTGTMARLFSDLEIAFRIASSALATSAREPLFGVTQFNLVFREGKERKFSVTRYTDGPGSRISGGDRDVERGVRRYRV